MNLNKRTNEKITLKNIKRIKDEQDELTDEKTLVNTHSKRLKRQKYFIIHNLTNYFRF